MYICKKYIDMNKENCNWSMTWDYSKWEAEPYYNTCYTQKDWNQILFTSINMISNKIHLGSFVGGGNKILAPFKFKKLFESLDYYDKSYNMLSSRYKVDFIDSNENAIYVYRDLFYEKIKAVPLVSKGSDTEISEVTFKHVSVVTNQEIEEYRKKLCGYIEIINYPVEPEAKYKITVSIERAISENIKGLIEEHLTYNHPTLDEKVLLKLSKGQEDVLFGIENNHRTIIRKDRQVGMSSLINAMIACKLIQDTPIKILFYAHSRGVNYNTSRVIKENIRKLIDGLGLKLDFITNNSEKVILSNGNTIEYRSVNENVESSLCSVDIKKDDWVIFDEVGFGYNALPLYNYMKDKCKEPKITIISTQNGLDDMFFPIYMLGSKAGYFSIDFPWLDAHEALKDRMLNPRHFEHNQRTLISEYSGIFVVDNADKINYDIITRLIKPHLLPGEKFSLLELVDFIQKRIIVSNEINLR